MNNEALPIYFVIDVPGSFRTLSTNTVTFVHYIALQRSHDPLRVSQAKEYAKHQLSLWGIDYFDLFLVHFPISLQYVDRKDKYPPEWWGLDGGVHLRKPH